MSIVKVFVRSWVPVAIFFPTEDWREADQLAIYKHDRGVEVGSTEAQRDLNTRLRISSPAP